MAAPRFKAITDLVIAGQAVKAGETSTATQEQVDDALARGLVEPAPAAKSKS